MTVDREKRLVYSSFYGEVIDDDLLRLFSTIPSHPDFDPSFSEIEDFRKVTKVSISTLVVKTISRKERVFDAEAKQAIIAPRNHMFGMARMFQILAEETRPNMAVVRTMAEACEFLGIYLPEEPEE